MTFTGVQQDLHEDFVRLKILRHHVYYRREGDIDQAGSKQSPLAETVLHGEPSRALAVIEWHVFPYTIWESTNDRKHLLRYTEAGEFFLRACSVDEVIRFGNIDKGNSCLPFKLLWYTNTMSVMSVYVGNHETLFGRVFTRR